MKSLSLGYSPCPNDTFIFYAMIHGKINTDNLSFTEELLDVETLNQKAMNAELDITKISYHAFGHLRDTYSLLRSGGALGRGCGPLLIAKDNYAMEDLQHMKIAIPGKLTTACLLLKLYYSGIRGQLSNLIPMRFDNIVQAVAYNEVDAGLIIHESRFTYQSFGLRQIIDLGEWWEGRTGLPIPLGGIIANHSLGKDVIVKVNTVLKRSVEYAFESPSEPMRYIKQHSQELSEDVINKHIDLYVNDFSIDIGKEGEKAITELLSRAEDAGIIPASDRPVFL
ncbi:MAG: 1,4-dihydroxy-6-naphthoate synthase [Nitrospira bacterium SG8_35_4]|nr:MAG: 1,4-dihydroxy-6-naphthoate synthase [Nitrospira bacterium SG8_35_4]